MQTTEIYQLLYKLASQAKLECRPNPAVGAIIIKKGKILSEGQTQTVGGNHAEVEAIQVLTPQKTKNSHLYVNLMPCSFTGHTPPCTEIIIRSKIAFVHVANQDNNPRMLLKKKSQTINNSEIILKKAGIKIIYDCPQEIVWNFFLLNFDYFKSITYKQPTITLKYAMTLDGKMANRIREPQQITNNKSQIKTHKERAIHDAILIGGGTLLSDNPRLNVRWQQNISSTLNKQPIPIIIMETPFVWQSKYQKFYLLKKNKKSPHPIFLIPEKDIINAKKQSLNNFFWPIKAGFETIPYTKDVWKKLLKEKNITSIYFEGGPSLQTLILQTGLIDRVSIYIASKFYFDGEKACSPFMKNKTYTTQIKKNEFIKLKNLWKPHFEILDDNIHITAFLKSSLAQKLLKKIIPPSKKNYLY
jgi:diaminohydroxyphosphoribosylaminopyrimidine deaminase/5-amino-6-(5-phosphoribosylamino)uracil reductase